MVAFRAHASKNDAPTAAQIDKIFSTITSKRGPGLAVVVRRNGRTDFKREYGMRDLRSERPIKADTNFRLASMSKAFTAMAVMLLVHDGRLHYEDRVTDILPGFPAYGNAITIRNLLNHTSGLPSYEKEITKKYPNLPPQEIPQMRDLGVLRMMEEESKTQFVPGTQWEYSNTGYVILGMIVETVSGIRFGDFLQKRIFMPLNMSGTVAYENGRNEVRNRAYGYTKNADAWMETDQSPTSATIGDGGIYSSINDLIKWDDALRLNSLLSQSDIRPAITPVLLPNPDRLPDGPDGQPLAYGFGWVMGDYRGHHDMSHRGGTAGFHTYIERFLDDNLTIIVLCNRTDLQPRDLAHKIADLYFAHPQ